MRRRLTALVAATTSLILIALLVPIALLLRSGAEQRAISAAAIQAQQVAALSPAIGAGTLTGLTSTTVFLPDGSVVGAPASLTPSVRLAMTGQAFVARSGDGVEVLVPAERGAADGGAPGVGPAMTPPAGGVTVVRVFVPAARLHHGVIRAWVLLAALGLVLFLLGLLLADRLGRDLTRPVIALAATADRLAAGDLTARAVPAGSAEIRLVGAELNRLADRIAELLAAGREETADLAHRLRTPLTALRLDAEGLRDPDESARLQAAAARLAERIDELIRTARRPVREGLRADADLAAVARERVAFWAALAEDVGRPLTAVLPDTPVRVRAGAADLATALDALLDNALTHTPDGTAIRVTVISGPDGAGGACRVEDAGPGFAGPQPAERGRSAAGSTGLGLDIARRTAAAGGGGLRTGPSADLGGALVELGFAAPDAA